MKTKLDLNRKYFIQKDYRYENKALISEIYKCLRIKQKKAFL